MRTRPDKTLFRAAEHMRRHPTPAEAILWQELRAKRFLGLKFRRQHPIGDFVVDFVCLDRKVILELDGEVHRHQSESDAAREAFLRARGFTIVRIANHLVEDQLPALLARLRYYLAS